MKFRILLAVSLSLIVSTYSFGQDKERKSDKSDNPKLNRPDIHRLRPQFPTEELILKSEKSIQDGLNFLVKTQNKDGSWGVA